MSRLQIRGLLQHQLSTSTISSVVGYHVKTVSKWARRFLAGDTILDRTRTGRPRMIPAEVTQRLIAFYCQYNPLPGCGQWSLRWAHKYLDKHPQILRCPISRSSLHRRLNAHALKPHRKKYFLQISDPFFFEKMELIILVYQSSYEYLFCLDECTGLQALERLAPPLPAMTNHPAYHEPEYIRHGTVSLLSVLHVSTGQVFSEPIPDHTSSTVLAAVTKHVSQIPKSATIHYILDNYSSHSTELFCEGIADMCDVSLPELKTQVDRRLWLQSPDKRIIFHFLPTHGSWLNLIEIWFGILTKKVIKDQSFSSATALADCILDFTDTWNQHFAHPFQWTYTGEGLHEKVISRFTRWIEMESPQLRPEFLKKQIILMARLTNNYWSKAKPEAWARLRASLHDKRDFLSSIQLDELPSVLSALDQEIGIRLGAS